MATVKEVQLMDGENEVTPVTLIDSVKNPDGTKYKDAIYTQKDINDMVKVLQDAIAEINKNI